MSVSVSAATPLGVIIVPGDSDLETCRLLIDGLQDDRDQVWTRETLTLSLHVSQVLCPVESLTPTLPVSLMSSSEQ